MADLTQFTWSGLTDGTAVDIYLSGWPRVGSGKVVAISPLHLRFTGTAFFMGAHYEGSLEITMPDTSPAGTCTVAVNGRMTECAYVVHADRLSINYPSTRITLRGNDRSWSWVRLTLPPFSFGFWPGAAGLTAADTIPSES